MSATRQDLFRLLDDLGIAHETHEHEAFFTVEEGRALKAQWPGGHSKSLFLKDKKKSLFLALALAETKVNLPGLSKRVARGRLSFGSPDLLQDILGVTPGSVTAFALINDPDRKVSVVVDSNLLGFDRVYFHPLENTASTSVSPDGLLAFIEAIGHEPIILDLATPLT